MINTRSLSTGLFVQLVAAKQPIDKIIAFLAFAVGKNQQHDQCQSVWFPWRLYMSPFD